MSGKQEKTEVIKTTTEIEHYEFDVFAEIVASAMGCAEEGKTTVIELYKEVKVRTNSMDLSEWKVLTDIGEDQCNFKWIQENFGPGRYKLKSKWIDVKDLRRSIYTSPVIAIGSLDQSENIQSGGSSDAVGVIRELKDVIDKNADMQEKYTKTVVDMFNSVAKNDTTKEIFNAFTALASKPPEPKDNTAVVAAIQSFAPAVIELLRPKETKTDKTIELMLQQSIEDRKTMTAFMLESIKQANQPKRSFDIEKAAGIAMQAIDFVSSKFKDNSNMPPWLQLVIENSDSIKEVVTSISGLAAAYFAPKIQALAKKSLPVEEKSVAPAPEQEQKSNGKELYKAILNQLELTKSFTLDPKEVAERIKTTPEYESGYIEMIKKDMDTFLGMAQPSQVNWLIECFKSL